jgi:glycosyltransferase involved in cell wall biosynthesis
MVTSLRARAELSEPEPARVARPALLVAVYANPDMYPPTINAMRTLNRTFDIRVVSRNTNESSAAWPAGVKIDRVGPPHSPREHEAASAFAKVRGLAHYLRHLRRAIAESKPGLIYAYDPLGFAAAMLVRPSALPVVFHCHDLPAIDNLPRGSLQNWLIRYALRRTRDAALVVFPEAHRAALWLESAGDDRAPLIVPNGAALDFFSPPRDWEVLAARRFNDRLALYMGWIGPDHGEFNAIRAISMTASARLAMIGSAPPQLLPILEQTISDGNERVELHSWSGDERMRLLERSAVGLVLYKSTSFNWEFSASAVNKLFEYGAAGLPVVVPDRKSYREFLADEKWIAFADVDDPRSIAQAIEGILADREHYLAMSSAAREAHETRFNYETLFQPVEERLSALVACNSR